MPARILPNAVAMSEFMGYSGDCTQTAALVAAHCLNPTQFPLGGATLNAWVAKSIAEGHASAPAGAETLDGCTADLKERGFQVEQHGYQQPLTYDWHTRLIEIAGYQPVVLQVANGAAFGIEATLHYHAVCILGHDPDTMLYYVADGDNPACAGGKLVAYSIQTLQASNPCGLLVVTLPPPPPPSAAKTQLLALIAQLQALAASMT